jgi:predicted XRE-type DNA-binding protein
MFTKLNAGGSTLSRREVRRIFRRSRGAQARIANELKVHPATISLWMRGKIQSERIDLAMHARAAELLAGESREACA